jgi:hypothetical protein
MKCSRSAIAIFLLLGITQMACSRRQAMYKQPKYKPYETSDFFSDHRASRPLVDGTVPHGKIDDHLNKGMVGGNPVNQFPFPITRKEIERGMGRFNIFCAPCHSRTGDGWGMVVQRGFKKTPVVPRSAFESRFGQPFLQRDYEWDWDDVGLRGPDST